MKFFPTTAIVALSLSMTAALHAQDLQAIPLKDIDGKETSLKAYAGKAILVVNVASKCGFTPQYTGLEALWKKYQAAGLVVLGFPSNDFGGQEPGTNAEIKAFCTSKFEVSFPMMDKVKVTGAEQHPLYAALTGSTSPVPGPVKWNFGKFLIGRDGKILARFDSKVTPDSAELAKAIDAALAAK
jgi:glutathione peroxidase